MSSPTRRSWTAAITDSTTLVAVGPSCRVEKLLRKFPDTGRPQDGGSAGHRRGCESEAEVRGEQDTYELAQALAATVPCGARTAWCGPPRRGLG